LSSQPARSNLYIAAAIIIAGVLISSSLFVALRDEKTTVTVTCTGSSAGVGSASVTDCSRGLTLGLSASPTIAQGSNQTVTVSVSNDLGGPNTVSYTSFPSLPNGVTVSNLADDAYLLPLLPGCAYFGGQVPAYFFMVLNASGHPMQLNDEPPIVVSCLSSGPPKSYSFTASQAISSEISVGGYWTSPDANEPWVNATYHQFPPGGYTLLAFDPWGQTVEVNFSVDLRDATQLYQVTFQQVRYCGQYNILPWAVRINGLTQVQPSNQSLPLPTNYFSTIVPDQNLTHMTFYLPSGTYDYTLIGGAPMGGELYTGSGLSSGTVAVNGANVSVNVEVWLSFTCAATTSTP
jgi:hypothetical protein